MSSLSILRAKNFKANNKLRAFIHDHSAHGALEYIMVLALLGLGATSILGVSAGFSVGIVQKLISAAAAVWPA